jgi:2'-5' RNA ligase
MVRAFLAVELTASIKQAIASAQEEIRGRLARELSPHCRIQWVKVEAIHLTVKFLGDIPEAHVDGLKPHVVQELSSLEPFSVEIAGFGCFPDLRAPRILWVGLVEESGASGADSHLAQVAARVEKAAATLGYPPEARPFSPHLTVARIKEGSREIGQALARLALTTQDFRLGALRVHQVSLMQSVLKPSGAQYTRLWHVSLGAELG